MDHNLSSDDESEDEDELALLINIKPQSRPKYHVKFCSKCIKLLNDFSEMSVDRKAELIEEMMKLKQFEYLFWKYRRHRITSILFMMGISMIVLPYSFIYAIITHIQNMMLGVVIFTVILLIAYSITLTVIVSQLLQLRMLSWNRLKILNWSKVYNMETMHVSTAMNIYNKFKEIYMLQHIVTDPAEFDIALVILSYP